MSAKCKTYLTIFLAILLAVFILNSPLALAAKVPKVCNLFSDKIIHCNGPCGNPGEVKRESLKIELITLSIWENVDNKSPYIIPLNFPTQSFFGFSINSLHSIPLRC